MNCNHFGDLLIFQLAPLSDQIFYLFTTLVMTKVFGKMVTGSFHVTSPQNSELFPVHVMDFLEKIHVKTYIKFMGPCKILQLYSKYFFSYEFLKFHHFCHSLYVY